MLRYERSMITKQTHTTVYVTDQDRAKAFYTEKLGFEVRDDARMGAFRWLTVAPKTQPDMCIVLYGITPGAWMTEDNAAMIKKLVEGGAIGGGVLECDDIRAEYETLKAKGVEFKGEPKEMPYGIEAVFKDDSGNFWSLGQKR
jgi:catechol 2,3-dioxygenase-like lactoylglutathione lyase family enzyme